MFGTFALAATVLFLVLAVARLRGSALPALRLGVPFAAALAAIFALLHWSSVADSRWLVGAVLIAGAVGPSLIGTRRAVAIVTLVLGLLAAALFGIATASPMQRPAVVA